MSDYFTVHLLNETGISRAKRIQELYEEFAENLNLLIGTGRHASITMTKLEESCFFAKKAMASREVNQVQPTVES